MKPMGSGNILQSKVVEPAECLHYAMNLPTSVVITGCDSLFILETVFADGAGFSASERRAGCGAARKTVETARDGHFEVYKTSTIFDGTGHNPQWLG